MSTSARKGLGSATLQAIHWNLGAPQLYEHALQRDEAQIAAHGALVADTGAHTGRSPKDKFVVRDARPKARSGGTTTMRCRRRISTSCSPTSSLTPKARTLFAQDLYAGADPTLRLRTRVFTEYAWHSLFIRNLLIRPPVEELATFVPELTIVDLPSFRADPKRHGARSETIIACDFSRKIVLIGGTSYAGEMKKSVFTVLNYLLPAKQVMPMHCSANTGAGRRFGDLLRPLRHRQDDALRRSAPHAHRRRRARLGPHGIFNFEGGCYAKAIKLSREAEPEIYATTERFGTVMENVTLDPASRIARFRRRIEDREYPHRLSAQFHRQRVGDGPRRSSEKYHHADLRRVRRVAADRETRSGAGDVSFPVRLHRQGGGHGERRHRAAGDVFDLFRRAVPAAASDRLWRSSARTWSRVTMSIAGSSTPDGPAASLALEGACRSG